MSLAAGDRERLAFLARVIDAECRNLQSTDERLFEEPFTPARASTLSEDAALAERVDAFVARFSRLQDTLGDKLLPVLLAAVGEDRSTLIDRLDQAERLGWIESSDEWMAIRQLRNQMIHEYIEDVELLANALQSGHQHVAVLLQAAQSMRSEISNRGWLAP